MYTRVRNNTSTISTNGESFAWPKMDEESKAPRYDKIIQSVTLSKINDLSS